MTTEIEAGWREDNRWLLSPTAATVTQMRDHAVITVLNKMSSQQLRRHFWLHCHGPANQPDWLFSYWTESLSAVVLRFFPTYFNRRLTDCWAAPITLSCVFCNWMRKRVFVILVCDGVHEMFFYIYKKNILPVHHRLLYRRGSQPFIKYPYLSRGSLCPC